MDRVEPADARDAPAAPALEARDIHLDLGDGFRLDGIDLDLPTGEITAVVGPNGSGKTTLLRVLAGISEPDHGEVRIAGRPADDIGRRARARRVGLLPQTPRAPPDLTVRELVARGRYPHQGPLGRLDADDRQVIREAMRTAEVTGLTDRAVGTLSGGERRRAWIALALAQRPDVVLLDEPTAHLDLRYASHTLEIIGELRDDHGFTVGVVLHDLNEAVDLADRIVLLDDGRVAASGPPGDVIAADRISDVFGADVRVEEHPAGGRPLVLPRRNGGPDPATDGRPETVDDPSRSPRSTT